LLSEYLFGDEYFRGGSLKLLNPRGCFLFLINGKLLFADIFQKLLLFFAISSK